jgi:hypothetical protein
MMMCSGFNREGICPQGLGPSLFKSYPSQREFGCVIFSFKLTRTCNLRLYVLWHLSLLGIDIKLMQNLGDWLSLCHSQAQKESSFQVMSLKERSLILWLQMYIGSFPSSPLASDVYWVISELFAFAISLPFQYPSRVQLLGWCCNTTEQTFDLP